MRQFTNEKTQNSRPDAEPKRRATLVVKDKSFPCWSFGSHTPISGEVVFTTGMVGYTESLTDPSYTGQLLCLTFPMIGNYGVPDRAKRDKWGLPCGFEGSKIHASALICQEYSTYYSHWNAESSLGDWLKEQKVAGIEGIDTRMLTKMIREEGAILGKIIIEGEVRKRWEKR